MIDVTLVSMSPGISGGPAKSGPAAASAPKARKEAPPSPKVEKSSEGKEPERKVQEAKPPEPKPPEPKPPVTREPPAVAPEKEVISLAPKKIAPKESLKKKTFNPQTVVESALKRIEKKVEDSHSDPVPPRADPTKSGLASVKSSIERMRAAVEKREASTEGKIGNGAAGDGAAENSAGGDSAAGGVGTGSAPELIYRSQIASYIRENWAYSEQLADKNKNLTAWVMIEVMPDGKIRDFWFEKRSGNAYLDESVSRAIQKSTPLPPFPPGVRQSSIHQGFRFTPMGIQ
jgi:colicin import membrane protein